MIVIGTIIISAIAFSIVFALSNRRWFLGTLIGIIAPIIALSILGSIGLTYCALILIAVLLMIFKKK